jgi:hypothetical protein
MHTTVEPLSLLARAKRVAKENGAALVGGKQSGRFSHDMVGASTAWWGKRSS